MSSLFGSGCHAYRIKQGDVPGWPAPMQDAVLPSKGPPSPLEAALDLQASRLPQLPGATAYTGHHARVGWLRAGQPCPAGARLAVCKASSAEMPSQWLSSLQTALVPRCLIPCR